MANRFALIIGIDRYQESGNDLEGCEADAKAFEAFFRSDRGGAFDENEVLVLLNDQGTRAIILRVLAVLADYGPWDQLHIVFAGHGSDDGIVAHDEMIGYDEIQAALDRIGCRRTLLILDSCQSGALIDTLSVGGVPVERDPKRVREYLKRLSEAVFGLRVITATDRRHYAEEVNGRGAFSRTFLRAASAAKPDLGSTVSAKRVLETAAGELCETGLPIPEGLGELGDYPIAVAAESKVNQGPSLGETVGKIVLTVLAAAVVGRGIERVVTWDSNVGRHRGSDGRFKR